MNKHDAHIYLVIKKLVHIFAQKEKIRRGVVHSAISDALGLKLNNKNVQLIKKALEQFSPKEVRIRGLEYYRFREYDAE